jgi:hypothetical protein
MLNLQSTLNQNPASNIPKWLVGTIWSCNEHPQGWRTIAGKQSRLHPIDS